MHLVMYWVWVPKAWAWVLCFGSTVCGEMGLRQDEEDFYSFFAKIFGTFDEKWQK